MSNFKQLVANSIVLMFCLTFALSGEAQLTAMASEEKRYKGLIDEIQKLKKTDQYKKILPLANEAFVLSKQFDGVNSTNTAVASYLLAEAYHNIGENLERAEDYYIQAVQSEEKVAGKTLKLADYKNALAVFYHMSRDQWFRAKVLYDEALRIRIEIAGNDSLESAKSYSSLANYHIEYDHDLAEAIGLARKALSIFEENGDNSVEMRNTMAVLAECYLKTGDLFGAEYLCRKALEQCLERNGIDDLESAACEGNLGVILMEMGKLEEAFKHLESSRLTFEKYLPKGHRDVGASYNNLGECLGYMGQIKKADEYYQRALQTFVRASAEGSTIAARIRTGYARFLIKTGQYERALSLSFEALNALNKKNVHLNTQIADVLVLIGDVYHSQKQFDKTIECYNSALQIYFSRGVSMANLQSSRQQVVTSAMLQDIFGKLLNETLRSGGAVDNVAVWALLLKGYTGDNFIRAGQQLRDDSVESHSREAAARYMELLELAKQISGLRRFENGNVLPRNTDANALLVQEKLEQDYFKALKRVSTNVSDGVVISERIQASLSIKQDCAFVNIWEFYAKGADDERIVRKIVAFLYLGKKHRVQIVSLGDSMKAEKAYDIWVELVNKRADSVSHLRAVHKAGRVLCEIVFDSIRAQLPSSVNHVLISPDGVLSRVPFAALSDVEEDSYLIEKYRFTFVPIAKRFPEPVDNSKPVLGAKRTALLLGDVDYAGQPSVKSSASRSVLRFKNQESGSAWSKLLQTKGELDAIEKCLDGSGHITVSRLTGVLASEDRVRDLLPSCNFAHFATHGFYSSDELGTTKNWTDIKDKTRALGASGDFNPGLRCAIVLTGADRPYDALKDDGYFTAYEIQMLDLINLDLVVLSACDSGLGRALGGESVFSIQNAFHLAGAKSAVASLWSVPDEQTMQLMSIFYGNVFNKGMEKGVALRAAQVSIMNDYRAGRVFDSQRKRFLKASPYYWGAWEISGSPW